MATAATLNPEPSLPAGHLPPKSYVDPTEQSGYNGSPNGSSTREFYAGEGEDETLRSPRRKLQKRTASPRVNGRSKEQRKSSIIVEKFGDKDGEHLTSLRSGWNPPSNGKSERKGKELVSGRKAGARWEQSQ